jgi:hypothetical protein
VISISRNRGYSLRAAAFGPSRSVVTCTVALATLFPTSYFRTLVTSSQSSLIPKERVLWCVCENLSSFPSSSETGRINPNSSVPYGGLLTLTPSYPAKPPCCIGYVFPDPSMTFQSVPPVAYTAAVTDVVFEVFQQVPFQCLPLLSVGPCTTVHQHSMQSPATPPVNYASLEVLVLFKDLYTK